MIGVTCPRCQQPWFCDEVEASRARLCPACAQGGRSEARSAPPSAFGAALRDFLGWTLVIFATLLCGLWLGMSVAAGQLVSPVPAFFLLIVIPFSWLFFPQVLIACAVTFASWYLPMRY